MSTSPANSSNAPSTNLSTMDTPTPTQSELTALQNQLIVAQAQIDMQAEDIQRLNQVITDKDAKIRQLEAACNYFNLGEIAAIRALEEFERSEREKRRAFCDRVVEINQALVDELNLQREANHRGGKV